METITKQKRYTLSLPETVHEELIRVSENKGISLRELILRSLKLGMIASETEGDSSKELLIRETISSEETKETRLILI